MRIFEIISRQAGALPALTNSTEFAFTAKGITPQAVMLSSRAEKLQDGDALKVTSYLHQHNSNSEKRTLTASKQRFFYLCS